MLFFMLISSYVPGFSFGRNFFMFNVLFYELSSKKLRVRQSSPYNRHKGPEGSTGTVVLFFNFSARWGLVANATLRPLCRRERDPVAIV